MLSVGLHTVCAVLTRSAIPRLVRRGKHEKRLMCMFCLAEGSRGRRAEINGMYVVKVVSRRGCVSRTACLRECERFSLPYFVITPPSYWRLLACDTLLLSTISFLMSAFLVSTILYDSKTTYISHTMSRSPIRPATHMKIRVAMSPVSTKGQLHQAL